MSSKGTEERLGYIEGWFPKEDEEAFRMAIEALQGDWTPVSEGSPSEPFGCIVTVWDSPYIGGGDDFENILPYFVGWDGEQWNDGNGEQCPFEVIAWMPVPMPYRESEDKE